MSCGWLGCDRRQVSSPLYSVENNSSGEVIPSTLCEHEGGGRPFTASLFIYVALGGPFASGRVDRHSPPLFLLPISFPQYRSRTEQGPRPRGPCVAALSPSALTPLSGHCFPTLASSASLSPSASSPVRAFPLAAVLAWKALPRAAAGPAPRLQVSAQTSEQNSPLTPGETILPRYLPPRLLYVSS